MRGKNFSIRVQRWKYIVTDFVMTSVAFFLFNLFRYHEVLRDGGYYPDIADFIFSPKILLEQVVVPVCLMGIYAISGYYNQPYNKSRLQELSNTLFCSLTNALLIYLILLINDSSGIRSRDYLVIIMAFSLLFFFTYLGRWIWTSITINHLRQGHWIYSILIVGNSRKSRDIYKKLKEAGSVWAYDVVGFIRIAGEKDVEDDLQVWDSDMIREVCEKHNVDQIVLSPETRNDGVVMRYLDLLFPLGLPVKIAPDTLSYVTSNIKLNDILGVPLVDLTSPRMGDFQTNVKRVFDVAFSLSALILLSPVMVWAAVKVRLSSPGPVFYSQERIGKKQKPFRIYKFRSMRIDAEADGPQLSSADDPRITPFGRLMRKYRIDEFPQFWNVIRGDMSLVGPRPEREHFIHQIMKSAPYYGLVFQIRPGITSWGMVKYGYASSIPEMVERSRYDLIYINNMSLSTDIKILIYTVRTVVKGAGV